MKSIKRSDNGIEQKVLNFFHDYSHFFLGKVLVGFSGGPDSTALVHALYKTKDKTGISISCAYLDHGLRDPADRAGDAVFVRTFCRERKITLYEEHLSPGSLEGERAGRSTEEAARDKRYDFFFRIQNEKQFDFIALGHNEDDFFETMIMRFFQGSHFSGLRGIPQIRGAIVRPFLGISREEIMEYLSVEGTGFRIDSTNEKPIYLRNKVRLSLVPLIKDIFPGYKNALGNLAAKMASAEEFLRSSTSKNITWTRTEYGFSTQADKFLTQPETVQFYSLYSQYDIVNKDREKRVPYTFWKSVIPGDKKKIHLSGELGRGHGVIVRIEDGLLFLERDVVLSGKKRYFIVVENENFYQISRYVAVRVFEDVYDGSQKGTACVLKSTIQGPIVLRSRREGDVIHLEYGRKSVKKILSEWKILPRKRWEVPVIEDQRGIVAVLCSFLGKKDLVRKESCEAGCNIGQKIILFQTEKTESDSEYEG